LASTLLRCILVAIAVVVGAWLVLGLRMVDLQSEGAEALERGVTPAEVAPARRALRDAGWLNADKTPRIMEGYLLTAAGRRREAAMVAERVVREEPENLEAWGLMYLASRDPQRAAQARRVVRRLDPYASDELDRALPLGAG
jgi:hypothetical protein